MTQPRNRTVPQFAAAATELHRAADLADIRSDDNPFSHWAALAGQLRLVASGLSALGHAPVPSQGSAAGGEGDVEEFLSAASAALNEISAADAPEDFAFWVGHVDDLRDLITDLGLGKDTQGRRS